MRKHLIFLEIFVAILPLCLHAQGDTVHVIKAFTKKNFVQPYVGTFNRTFLFDTKEPTDKVHELRFSPNSSAYAGVSINYKKLSVYLELSIPNTRKVNDQTGIKSLSLFANYFKDRWGVTGFVSRNSGLLMYMPSMGMYGNRNDLNMFTIGTNFYKIFNGKNFSYVAANSTSKLQTKSSGSFVIMATPLYRRMFSNESIIPSEQRRYHLNGTEMPSRSLQFYSLHCKPGYIYNLVFNKGKYFISPALYVGGGADWHIFKTDEEVHSAINAASGYRGKLVTGINTANCYFTIEYLRDKTTTYLYKTNISNTYTEISCNFGVRF
ncbi:MAG: DUF4421 family protein [Chitinophagaceae bacterium]